MAESTLFRNARVLTERGVISGQDLRYQQGEVVAISKCLEPATGERVVDCRGGFLLPPVLDLHVHGGGGHSFLPNQREPAAMVKGIRSACRAQYRYGTRWLLATLPLASPERWWEALEAVEEARDRQRREGQPLLEAEILGAYLEGPFLNPEMAGGMEGNLVSQWRLRHLEELLERFGNLVKVITLAPEHPLARDVLFLANRFDVMVFLGHSQADFGTTERALGWGAVGFTHLFNAMAPYHHREPGILGAALLSEAYCELIAEPGHLHPASWQLALRVKGREWLIAVSDGSPLACCPDDTVEWCGASLTKRGTASCTPDGRLCGTALSLIQGLAILDREEVVPIQEGVSLATRNPSELLGVDAPRHLSVGYRGPLVLLTEGETPKVEVFG